MWIIPVPIKSSTTPTSLQNNINKLRFKKCHQHTNDNVYELNLIQDQINYLYAGCFSPPKSLFLHAIKEGFLLHFLI